MITKLESRKKVSTQLNPEEALFPPVGNPVNGGVYWKSFSIKDIRNRKLDVRESAPKNCFVKDRSNVEVL